MSTPVANFMKLEWTQNYRTSLCEIYIFKYDIL